MLCSLSTVEWTKPLSVENQCRVPKYRTTTRCPHTSYRGDKGLHTVAQGEFKLQPQQISAGSNRLVTRRYRAMKTITDHLRNAPGEPTGDIWCGALRVTLSAAEFEVPGLHSCLFEKRRRTDARLEARCHATPLKPSNEQAAARPQLTVSPGWLAAEGSASPRSRRCMLAPRFGSSEGQRGGTSG